jgi:hypothetical protein
MKTTLFENLPNIFNMTMALFYRFPDQLSNIMFIREIRKTFHKRSKA